MSVEYKYMDIGSKIIKNVTIKMTSTSVNVSSDDEFDKLYEHPSKPYKPSQGYSGLIGDVSKR